MQLMVHPWVFSQLCLLLLMRGSSGKNQNEISWKIYKWICSWWNENLVKRKTVLAWHCVPVTPAGKYWDRKMGSLMTAWVTKKECLRPHFFDYCFKTLRLYWSSFHSPLIFFPLVSLLIILFLDNLFPGEKVTNANCHRNQSDDVTVGEQHQN